MQEPGKKEEVSVALPAETVNSELQPKKTHAGLSRVVSLAIIFALAAMVVLFDQVSKEWIRHHLASSYVYMIVIPRVIHFVYVENFGAAFGMLQGATTYFIITAIIVFIMVAAFVASQRRHKPIEIVSLGLIVGGAIGNLIDRVMYGYVTDFIALTFMDFPVFNIADIGVTVGAVLFIISLIVRMINEENY